MSPLEQYESESVAIWRNALNEKALDKGCLKFSDLAEAGRKAPKKRKPKYTPAQDDYIVENYGRFAAAEIAAFLSTPRHEITKNMVIGRYNRIKDTHRPSGEPSLLLQMLDSLIREGHRCKMMNNGCRNPNPPRLVRADGNRCTEPGCHNQRIPYTTHQLCSVHNADRLSKARRVNRGAEVTTSVSAGWMG